MSRGRKNYECSTRAALRSLIPPPRLAFPQWIESNIRVAVRQGFEPWAAGASPSQHSTAMLLPFPYRERQQVPAIILVIERITGANQKIINSDRPWG